MLTLKKKFKLKSVSEVRNVYIKDIVVGMKPQSLNQQIASRDILKKFMADKIDKTLSRKKGVPSEVLVGLPLHTF